MTNEQGTATNDIQYKLHRAAYLMEIPEDSMTELEKKELCALLDALHGLNSTNVDAIGEWVKLQSARVDALREEARNLVNKAKASESRMEKFKESWLQYMRLCHLNKVEGKVYRLALRNINRVSVTDNLDNLPEEYIRERTTREPNKAKIKQHLLNGVIIDGCELVSTPYLQVS